MKLELFFVAVFSAGLSSAGIVPAVGVLKSLGTVPPMTPIPGTCNAPLYQGLPQYTIPPNNPTPNPPADQIFVVDLTTEPDQPVETEKINMTAPEIIAYQGFPNETHKVQTADYYINTIFRIPNPGKTPVYLLHGILCTARDFLVQPGNGSLPFQLFNAGFDVWIGNIRGNAYSSENLNYTTEDDEFWKFSNDEVISYENPAVIDYILNVTGYQKLIWIGYSLGTYTFLGTMAALPEYNSKILQFVGLAPVNYIGNITYPLRSLGFVADQSQYSGALDHGAFTPQYLAPLLNVTLPAACMAGDNILNDVQSGICSAFLSFLAGPNANETSKPVLPVAFSEFPSSISGRSIKQIIQDMRDPEFRKYDGGARENLKMYKNVCSPQYNVSAITAPMILYSGLSDGLVVVADTDRLANDLPTYPRRRYVQHFNHLDFVYGRHVPELGRYIVQDLLNIVNSQP